MRENRFHFDADYSETATLADGTQVLLRLVGPADKALLRRAFQDLSTESRYSRFFTHKAELSEAELEALTSMDGINQLALGAITFDARREPIPLAVARFVRVPERPAVADAAVAVVDAFQTRGLGTLMVQRLAAAARERGIVRFSCEFFLRNEKIRHLIECMAPMTSYETDGEVAHVEIPVPETEPGASPTQFDRDTPLHQLLGHSASGAIQVRLQRAILKLKE